jgi:catechol 2,3-dioxygenase-like lactoylglutathione lyase family enzyme
MTLLHHAAICTDDVERGLRFWRDGLGFTQLFDAEFPGDWRTLFWASDDSLRSVFLGQADTPDSGIVELVVFDDVDPLPERPARPALGFFLLSVMTDVDAALERLASLGFDEGVRRIDQPGPRGSVVPMAVVHGPDGVLVELIGAPR